MRKSQERVGWEQLPIEMWGKIFFWLKSDVDADMDSLISDDQQQWEAFYLLRSVCTKFKAVFAQHPEYYSALRMTADLRAENLPGLFQWVKQHWSSVTSITASCGSPCLEAALAALGSHQAHDRLVGVSTVHIDNAPLYTASLLAQFLCLSKAHLDPWKLDQRQGIDVRPFRNLPHFKDLAVCQGSVQNLDAAAHLTSLTLRSCVATCSRSCGCVSSLVTLSLFRSTLAAFHAKGVSCCSELQYLQCRAAGASHIAAGYAGEDMKLLPDQDWKLPSSLSSLTALTELHFGHSMRDSEMQLDWLTELSALQSLTLSVGANSFVFPSVFSTMTRLSRLAVYGSTHTPVKFSFDWAGLIALSALSLWVSASFDNELSSLAALQSLRHVDFRCMVNFDDTTAKQLGLFAYALGARRDVSFNLV